MHPDSFDRQRRAAQRRNRIRDLLYQLIWFMAGAALIYGDMWAEQRGLPVHVLAEHPLTRLNVIGLALVAVGILLSTWALARPRQ
jgi:hypothetical protein